MPFCWLVKRLSSISPFTTYTLSSLKFVSPWRDGNPSGRGHSEVQGATRDWFGPAPQCSGGTSCCCFIPSLLLCLVHTLTWTIPLSSLLTAKHRNLCLIRQISVLPTCQSPPRTSQQHSFLQKKLFSSSFMSNLKHPKILAAPGRWAHHKWKQENGSQSLTTPTVHCISQNNLN